MTKNRFYIFLVLGVLCFSCGKTKISPPQNLIAKDTMEHILFDLAILNAASGVHLNALQKAGVKPHLYVYKKYGIDSLQFAQSSVYYSTNPLEMADLYAKVTQRLQKLEKEFTALEKEKAQQEITKKQKK